MVLPFAWAMAIAAGMLLACFFFFRRMVRLANDHFKTGCLLMATAVLLGLTQIALLLVFLAEAPVYIAREASGRVRVTRNVVLGPSIRMLGNGDRQRLTVRWWEGSLLVNDTSRELRIRRVLYNVHSMPPGLPAGDPEVVRPYTVMPLSHRLHHFGEGDEPPDHVRVEKGREADARYQITW